MVFVMKVFSETTITGTYLGIPNQCCQSIVCTDESQPA